jgi:hypothetical protein
VTNTRTPRAYRLNPKRRIIGKLFLLVVLLSVAGHQLWGWNEGQSLMADVAALRRQGEPMLREDFQTASLADADNSAVALRLAADASPQTVEDWNGLDVDALAAPLTSSEAMRIRRVVHRHEAALRHLRSASAKPGVDWNLHLVTPVIFSQVPDLSPQRNLSNFVGLTILLAHHDRDEAAALRGIRDLLFIAAAVDSQPILVAHMTAAGITELATNRLGDILPGMRMADGVAAADIQALIDALLDSQMPKAGILRALRGERAWQHDTIRAIADGNMSVRALRFEPPDRVGISDNVTRVLLKPMLMRDGQMMIHESCQVIEALTADDWPTASTWLPPEVSSATKHPMQHLFACILTPHYPRYVRRHFEDLTNRRLAAVSLALRWYASAHDGLLPSSLEDLVPKYLPAVPRDPMAASRRLGYVSDSTRPVVYSAGEDGVDDGGSDASRNPRFPEWRGWNCRDFVIHLAPQPRRITDVVMEPTPTGMPTGMGTAAGGGSFLRDDGNDADDSLASDANDDFVTVPVIFFGRFNNAAGTLVDRATVAYTPGLANFQPASAGLTVSPSQFSFRTAAGADAFETVTSQIIGGSARFADHWDFYHILKVRSIVGRKPFGRSRRISGGRNCHEPETGGRNVA